MHLYPPLSVDLMRRLGCLNQVRFQRLRPRDGGDYFDTFEGWQQRGRRVRKGAVSLRRWSDLDPARFPFHETLPDHATRTATR